jgi:hypothetical protein
MAPVLPFIMAASAIFAAGTSIYSLAKGAPEAPGSPAPSKSEQSRQALEAAYAQAQLLRQRRGAASTILTGPLGVSTPPQTIKATLGG